MAAKFILSKSKVFEQLSIMKELADEVSYSFKSNPEIGKMLQDKCFLSIHSENNLKQVSSENVWFFLQGNNPPKEVNNFVVDNINDLNLLL